MPLPSPLRKRHVSAMVASAYANPAVQPETSNLKPGFFSGALSRVMSGLFGGIPNPAENASAEVQVPSGHLYRFHEGDLFTPGTQNFVFESPWELPLFTLWGNGTIRTANTFNPIQPPQVYSEANVVINGLGGLMAGSIAHQPLESDGQ